MPPSEITPRDALIRLGASTAEAVANVLEMFAPDTVERGDVTVIQEGATPFSNMPPSAIVASVHYVDGVTGANVFVMTPKGARALAAAMGAGSPTPRCRPSRRPIWRCPPSARPPTRCLPPLPRRSASCSGRRSRSRPPTPACSTIRTTRRICSVSRPTRAPPRSPSCGEPCRLIQLVPSAFVVRMARALDEMELRQRRRRRGGRSGAPRGDGDGPVSLDEALRGVDVRVWAELGRTRFGLGQALELPVGRRGGPRPHRRTLRLTCSSTGCASVTAICSSPGMASGRFRCSRSKLQGARRGVRRRPVAP